MQYVVLVDLGRHYDYRTGGFKDLAFKSSNDGSGASVIQRECGVSASGSICQHIDEFYPGIGGEPAAFWGFDDSIITPPHIIEQVEVENGDDCHYEVKIGNGSRSSLNKALRRISKTWAMDDLFICDEKGMRKVIAADIPTPDYTLTDRSV